LSNKTPLKPEADMNNKEIEWRKRKLEQEKRNLQSGQLNGFRELLPDELIYEMCRESDYDFRDRRFTPVVTVFHMISAGIHREGSFQSAWHMAGQSGASGSLAKCRKRLPLEVWKKLDQRIVDQIHNEATAADRWKGHRMVGVDGTCVSMPDEPGLAIYFGRANTYHGESRFPLARTTLVFDLKTLTTVDHETGPYQTGETDLLRQMLPKLRSGDVMVADRHYAGANLYWEYQNAGVYFITRIHQALNVDGLEVLKDFGSGGKVVQLPIHETHRKKNPKMPESILIRLIRMSAKIEGKNETFWIATSLLDPIKYPAQEVQGWLKQRWRVETLIEELKVWVGADVLRSKTVKGVMKEIHARVIGLNLTHWLILRAARKHHKKASRLSVSAALRLTVSYSLKMSTAPAWQLPHLYDALLEHIAFSQVPERPDRIEPRMIKRETKYYPALKISRQEWRNLHGLAA
jgi:hypothetical protein